MSNKISVQLLAALAPAEGTVSISKQVLTLENGQAFDLAATAAELKLLVKKAEAFSNIMSELEEAGFGADDPINGGDCVDMMAALYNRFSPLTK